MPNPNRDAAQQYARDLLANLSLTDVPVDPFEVAKRLEIKVEAADVGTDFSGCLLQAGSKFAILYSSAIDHDGFRAFTVSHEIGHYEIPSHRFLYGTGDGHRSQSNFTAREWYEQEADAFASELLMPATAMLAEMRGADPGLATIKKMADRFLTSLTSTAIRYAELTPDPVVVIVSDSSKILYSFRSACMKSVRLGYIDRGAPIPNASVTGRLMRERSAGKREMEGGCYLSAWVENPVRDLPFSEDVIDLGRYGRILTVLHREQLPADDDDDGEDDY